MQACSVFLSGAKCPSNLQIVAAYGGQGGYQNFKGDCACGTIDVSDNVRDALTAYLIQQKLAATAVPLNATAPPAERGLDVCTTFAETCSTLLDDIACPVALRAKTGCATPGAPTTLGGGCKCGALDASHSVMTALLGLALPEDTVQAAKVRRADAATKQAAVTGDPPVEFCETFHNTCTEFLKAVSA